MPRLNIEEEWFSDPRREELIKLVGELADAIAIKAWRLAQRYYIKKEKIPFHAWEGSGLGDELLKVGLAEKSEDGIYVRGSRRCFDWYFKRISSASKAGIESANSRRIKYGTSQPMPNQNRTTPNDTERSSSSSSSSSSSKKENTYAQSPLRANALAECVFDLESIYQKYPRKLGKQKGLKIALRVIRTQEKFEMLSRAVDNYRTYCETKNVEPRYIKHFSTFMNNWEDYVDPIDEKTKGDINWEYVFEGKKENGSETLPRTVEQTE